MATTTVGSLLLALELRRREGLHLARRLALGLEGSLGGTPFDDLAALVERLDRNAEELGEGVSQVIQSAAATRLPGGRSAAEVGAALWSLRFEQRLLERALGRAQRRSFAGGGRSELALLEGELQAVGVRAAELAALLGEYLWTNAPLG